jgi:thiamine monophosphate kinase
VPPQHCSALEQRLARFDCRHTAIGVIEAEPGIRCFLANGEAYRPAATGYLHFRDDPDG